MRSEADMAFLKWCTSGGNGPPPPEDLNAPPHSQSAANNSTAIVPRAGAPQAQMQMQMQMQQMQQMQPMQPGSGSQSTAAPPPKPTAKQLEDTFRAIAAKPTGQRTKQENEFLLGIQEMYKHRKGMQVRNNTAAAAASSAAMMLDEPKPPPALLALAQKRARAKMMSEHKNKGKHSLLSKL